MEPTPPKRRSIVGQCASFGNRRRRRPAGGGEATKNYRQPKSLDKFREQCLQKIQSDPPLRDFLVLGKEMVAAAVRYRLLVIFGLQLDGESLVEVALPGPWGPDVAYTVTRVWRAREGNKHLLCAHCLEWKNRVVERGLLRGYLCESCRIRLAREGYDRCGGGTPHCTGVRWVNELGLPSPVCKDCHQSILKEAGSAAPAEG